MPVREPEVAPATTHAACPADGARISFPPMAPDILLSKAVNWFVKDAEAKEHLAGSAAAAIAGVPAAGAVDRGINRAIARRKAKEGGLWVGGRLVLTSSRLSWVPNAANRAVHKQLPDEVAVELKAVRSVTLLPALVTKIVLVETDDQSVRFRCYGAASVAERLRKAARIQS
jgi:hypothetical protein